MTLCLSHSGITTYKSLETDDDILVGTVDGVIRLRKEKNSGYWHVAGHSASGSHVVGLAIEPRSSTIIAATHNNGIAFSEDGGTHWKFRNSGLESENVYSVNIAPANDGAKIYIGTEPARLYTSKDMGKTWTELSSLTTVPGADTWDFPAPPHDAHLKVITIHPGNPDTIFACIEQGGLFRSTDAGETWDNLNVPDPDIHRLLIPESNTGRYFVPTGTGIFRSNDYGASWSNITRGAGSTLARIGYPDLMTINPNNERLMFTAGARSIPPTWMKEKCADPKIARSRDGGESWEIVDNGLPVQMVPNFEAMALNAWQGDCAVYLATTSGEVFTSVDEGETWSKIADGLPPVSKSLHYLVVHTDMSGKFQSELRDEQHRIDPNVHH